MNGQQYRVKHSLPVYPEENYRRKAISIAASDIRCNTVLSGFVLSGNPGFSAYFKQSHSKGFSPTDYHGENLVGLLDVIMTYICFATALAVTMALLIYMGVVGIIPEMSVEKLLKPEIGQQCGFFFSSAV